MDTGSLITVDGLRRSYGSGRTAFEAVRGVDLHVRRGELFALLGTNGAGKTSLLEVVEGIAPATSGRVRVFGADPYRQRGKVRPRTGIMLQEAGFPADLTAGETARMWAGTLARPMSVGEALDAVGLTDRRNVPVASLSGGERRRLDLALAIMGRPEVLFLDEPTTGLDPQSRHDAWALVRHLLEAGTTVVLTTHYLEEAERLADRLAILHAGQIARTGTVAEIVAAEPARISYRPGVERLPETVLTSLPGLAGPPRIDGRRVTVESTDLQATLTALLTAAATADVPLTDLEASSASLERAFLAIAGRDAAHDPAHRAAPAPAPQTAA